MNNKAIQMQWENYERRASAKRAKAVASEAAKPATSKSESTVQNYFEVLRAIGAGASLPGQIISIANIPWLTTMQCLRTLEQIGLVSTICEANSQKRFSRLTEKGYDLLNEILSLNDSGKFVEIS